MYHLNLIGFMRQVVWVLGGFVFSASGWRPEWLSVVLLRWEEGNSFTPKVELDIIPCLQVVSKVIPLTSTVDSSVFGIFFCALHNGICIGYTNNEEIVFEK